MVNEVDYPLLERGPTLSDRITNNVLDMITSSSLKPGDRLPSERDLGARFGVSRTVVREAMRSLAAKGVLEVRTGSGTVVGRVGAQHASEALRLYVQTSQRSDDEASINYEQIDDVREMLEARVARIAATTATEDDLADLAGAHKQFIRKQRDSETASVLDVAFHRLIAVSTHNPLYLVMLDSIEPILLEIRRMTLRVPGRPDRAVNAHGRILERIVARDSEGAELAMIQHLEESRTVWREHGDQIPAFVRATDAPVAGRKRRT